MNIPIVVTLSAEAVDALIALEQDVTFPTWTKELFDQEFNNAFSTVYGVRLKGKLIAYMILHVVLDEVHVVNLVVAKDFRRQGIAMLVLDSTLRELAWEGAKWVYLEVRESNAAARKLYDAMGFEQTGTRERYYSNNQEDALTMRLDLQEYSQSRNPFKKLVEN